MTLIQSLKKEIRNHYRGKISREEILTLEGAFLDIEHLYRGQYRYSGLPVVVHSLRVGLMLCRIGADFQTTIAGLLHDILEDTHIISREIRSAYGPWYAEISDALKKTNSLHLTHQKLLFAGRHDIRSLMIKLCDRLDNLRELQWLPAGKRSRIALESKSFYLPLASRVNIPGSMREELKSLAARYI